MNRLQVVCVSAAPYVRSLVRVLFALLFASHGGQKLFGFPPGGHVVPEGTLLFKAGWIEIIGGALLLLGLFTRPVALILCGEMAFAYFLGHAKNGFFPAQNGGEFAVLYCFAFLYFFCAGPGPISLDALFRTRRAPSTSG